VGVKRFLHSILNTAFVLTCDLCLAALFSQRTTGVSRSLLSTHQRPIIGLGLESTAHFVLVCLGYTTIE
jgi:hypothetical protein